MAVKYQRRRGSGAKGRLVKVVLDDSELALYGGK